MDDLIDKISNLSIRLWDLNFLIKYETERIPSEKGSLIILEDCARGLNKNNFFPYKVIVHRINDVDTQKEWGYMEFIRKD